MFLSNSLNKTQIKNRIILTTLMFLIGLFVSIQVFLIPILYRNKKVSELVIKVDGFLFEFSIHEPLEEIELKYMNPKLF